MTMSKEKVAKYLPGLIGLVILGFIAYVMFSVTTIPKTPATVEQVWDVMVAQGYEPQDITERYIEQDSNLEKCIAFQKDDVHFEFFNFNNKNSAINAYSAFYSHIVTTRRSLPYSEYEAFRANYHIYTLRASGTYSVAIYVGTTTVYAYCDEGNSNAIDEIRRIIGYVS